MNEWGLNGRHDWNTNDELIITMLYQTWRKWAVKSSVVISQYVIIHSCIKVITEQNKVQKGPWNKSELTNQICREQLDVLVLHRWSYTATQVLRGSAGRCRRAALCETHHQHLHSRTKKVKSFAPFSSPGPSECQMSWICERRRHAQNTWKSLWAGTPTQNLGLRPSRSKSLFILIFIFSQRKLKKK